MVNDTLTGARSSESFGRSEVDFSYPHDLGFQTMGSFERVLGSRNVVHASVSSMQT